MLMAGLISTAAVVLWALASSKSLTQPAATAVFRRGSSITVLGIGALLISSSSLFRVFHRDDPQLVKQWIRKTEHPNNPTYQAEFEAYRRQRYTTPK